MRIRILLCLALAMVILVTAGCGGFVARRIAQAPNTYPQWVAPEARVELAYSPRYLTNFPTRRVEVGPPSAQLTYRIVEPADYGLAVTSTNWVRRGRTHFKFTFDATVPGQPNSWSSAPRGTVLLLHGHGLAQFSTAPWALRLAEEGWRCVLVNLRGHGTSTGRRVYFGTREIHDLSQLLDHLAQADLLVAPVSVLGESYGAALALRWKAIEPRVANVVAIAPYAHLGDAVLNIRREYARWVPSTCIQAGLKRLPGLIEVDPGELDPLQILARDPVAALFIAGAEDRITPAGEVRRLYETAGVGSRFLVVPEATHEAVFFFFDDLVPPVLDWLGGGGRSGWGMALARFGFWSCHPTGPAASHRPGFDTSDCEGLFSPHCSTTHEDASDRIGSRHHHLFHEGDRASTCSVSSASPDARSGGGAVASGSASRGLAGQARGGE